MQWAQAHRARSLRPSCRSARRSLRSRKRTADDRCEIETCDELADPLLAQRRTRLSPRREGRRATTAIRSDTRTFLPSPPPRRMRCKQMVLADDAEIAGFTGRESRFMAASSRTRLRLALRMEASERFAGDAKLLADRLGLDGGREAAKFADEVAHRPARAAVILGMGNLRGR